MPNAESLLWVSHSSHVPDSLLISSSFPCNRSCGDRKNGFLFRLNCLLCLINSSTVSSIFVGQDNIHNWKFSFQLVVEFKTIYQTRSGFCDLPQINMATAFQSPRRLSQVVVWVLGHQRHRFALRKWKGKSVTISVCDKQKENDGVGRLCFKI